jgi:hypothetical protein
VIAADVARLRRVLDASAQEQLRAVGADATEALAEAADATEPGTTEHDAAGLLAESLRRRNLAPHVLLAAADERIAKHRHPLPFGATIEDRVMLVTFPGEWRLHHQGGMTGYASREVIATPSTDDPIETGQAFAWNPSITGAKAEETFVLTPTGAEVTAGAPSRTPL